MSSGDPSKTVRDLVDLLQRAKNEVPQELRDLAFGGGGSRFGNRRPPMNSYNRGSSYGGAPSYGGGGSAYGGSAPSYGGGPSSYGGSSSYNHSSVGGFNQAVLASTTQSIPQLDSRVGEKRPRESFSTSGDDRGDRRDDRDRDYDRRRDDDRRDDYRRDDYRRDDYRRDDYRRDDRRDDDRRRD